MSFEQLSFSKLPRSLQEKTIKKVAEVIKRGESVQLMGPPGSGNSLIAKLLTQVPDLRKKYFDNSRDYHFALVDGNMLLERNPLNLTRLFFSSLNMGDETSSDNVIVQKAIEESVSGICSKGILVIVIDHVNSLDAKELQPFFTNLLNLYRRFEPNMVFVILSERSFKNADELKNFGQFRRLITQNIIYTLPFNKEDSFWFISEREKQLKKKLITRDKEKIFKLTGGFPRTIKRMVDSLVKGCSLGDLEKNPSIDMALAMHLEELSNYSGNKTDIPILNRFLQNKIEKVAEEKIEGVVFKGRLTKIEEKVIKILLKNENKMVSRDEIITKVWGEKALDISDHAYDQIIHRLRKKLEGSSPGIDIETVKGRGHCLSIK
jgi:energy-coupling factor transporter ATP-binding protein EcfA2